MSVTLLGTRVWAFGTYLRSMHVSIDVVGLPKEDRCFYFYRQITFLGHHSNAGCSRGVAIWEPLQ